MVKLASNCPHLCILALYLCVNVELVSGSVASVVVPVPPKLQPSPESAGARAEPAPEPTASCTAACAEAQQQQPEYKVVAPVVSVEHVRKHVARELKTTNRATGTELLIFPAPIRHVQYPPGALDGETVISMAFVMPIEYEIAGKFLQLPADNNQPVWLGQVCIFSV